MRRRTLLPGAGLSAYFIGATVRAHLRRGDELWGCRGAGCRILAVAGRPRAALRRPLRANGHLVAPSCSD